MAVAATDGALARWTAPPFETQTRREKGHAHARARERERERGVARARCRSAQAVVWDCRVAWRNALAEETEGSEEEATLEEALESLAWAGRQRPTTVYRFGDSFGLVF